MDATLTPITNPMSDRPVVLSVSDLEFARGADDVHRLLPPPARLSHVTDRAGWMTLAKRILEQGISLDHEFVPLSGIDAYPAMRHVGAILASAIDEDTKIRATACLCSAWFFRIRVGDLQVGGEG